MSGFLTDAFFFFFFFCRYSVVQATIIFCSKLTLEKGGKLQMYPLFFSRLVGDKQFYGVSVISLFLRSSRKNETALGIISSSKYVFLSFFFFFFFFCYKHVTHKAPTTTAAANILLFFFIIII